MELLKVQNLAKAFFGLFALEDLTFHVNKGELVGLIGPNGSGKTTLFNCITGIIPITKGKIFFKGQDITNMRTHQIALRGITRSFQTVRTFDKMRVLDSILLAIQQHQGERIVGSMLSTHSVKDLDKEALERADYLMEFLDITRLKHENCESLSYGQKKLLEIAQTLAPSPGLVLLDEPAAAVNPTMIRKIVDDIRVLNQKGQTFLIIEHNMDVIMNLCERIIVLDHGRKIGEGTPEEIKNNSLVLEAYFGV